MKRLARTGLPLLFALPLLTSCGGVPTAVVTEAKVERVTPPTTLLEPCPEPKLRGSRNGDLAQHIIDLRYALEKCNADKEALRNWVNGGG